MKEITKLMINKYKMMDVGYDFMGYRFTKEKQLSFHHLLVPKRLCKAKRIPNDGYVEWNGAILRRDTAHDYLHTIEQFDLDMYFHITSEMIDENIKGRIDFENIRYIDDILCQFEKEYSGEQDHSGHDIIREEYTQRLIRRL